MAPRDAKPISYSRGRQPSLESQEFRQNFSPFSIFADEEFADLESVLKALNLLVIQVSEAEPAVPLKGMVRYAIAPWFPISSTGPDDDGLVVFDGTAWRHTNVT